MTGHGKGITVSLREQYSETSQALHITEDKCTEKLNGVGSVDTRCLKQGAPCQLASACSKVDHLLVPNIEIELLHCILDGFQRIARPALLVCIHLHDRHVSRLPWVTMFVSSVARKWMMLDKSWKVRCFEADCSPHGLIYVILAYKM